MRFGFNIVIVIGALLIFGGCAQLSTVTKKKHFNNHSEAVFIDAKQRAVFIQNRDSKNRKAICAEPSPDALSVYAASGGVDITTKAGASGAAQFAAAEAGGSIGLRTQSIQLMRDAMYRICEGYAGGALDKASFETLHRRFQQSMVTILAVEQLTGAVRPPALVLAGGASSDSESIRNVTAETRALRMEMDKRKEELDAKNAEIAQKKAESAKIDEAAKTQPNGAKTTEQTAAQTKLTSDIAELTEQQKTVQKSYDDAREAYEAQNALRSDIIRRGGDVGSAGGLLSGANASVLSKEAAASVATAVKDIVADYNELSFIEEVCTTVFTSFIDGNLAEDKMPYVQKAAFLGKDANGTPVQETLFDLCVTQLGKGVKEQEALVISAKEDLKTAKEEITMIRGEKQSLSKQKKILSIENMNLKERSVAYQSEAKVLEEAVEHISAQLAKVTDESEGAQNIITWMATSNKPLSSLCNNETNRNTIFGGEVDEAGCEQKISTLVSGATVQVLQASQSKIEQAKSNLEQAAQKYNLKNR